jgi:hypothetical protein
VPPECSCLCTRRNDVHFGHEAHCWAMLLTHFVLVVYGLCQLLSHGHRSQRVGVIPVRGKSFLIVGVIATSNNVGGGLKHSSSAISL